MAAKKHGRRPARVAGATRRAVKPTAGAPGQHTEHEDHPWTINIPDHPQRTDSPQYVRARKIMHSIADTVSEWLMGKEPFEDHHGGSLWVKDEQGWFVVKNIAGIEWSSQFCADPRKVDVLRQNARRLYAKFPLTAPALKAMGFDLQALLDTPITDAPGVAQWTDSICNAGWPLPKGKHTGVLPAKGKKPAPGVPVDGGVHHYPMPITDIELFKHDDFQLWVLDAQGQPTAVVPVAARGSGNSHVEVTYATPGTRLHGQLMKSHLQGQRLIFRGQHPLAKQAFRRQGGSSPGK